MDAPRYDDQDSACDQQRRPVVGNDFKRRKDAGIRAKPTKRERQDTAPRGKHSAGPGQ
jgi:hypothetical protein